MIKPCDVFTNYDDNNDMKCEIQNVIFIMIKMIMYNLFKSDAFHRRNFSLLIRDEVKTG